MEHIILKQLIENESFIIKALPHLKTEYFDNKVDKLIFNASKAFVTKYHKKPTYSVLKNSISKLNNLNEKTFEESFIRLDEIQSLNEEFQLKWLLDESEEFCQNKAVENALLKSVNIYEDKEKSNHLISDIFKDALRVSFNTSIGIEYWNDADIKKRFIALRRKNKKFESHLKQFNWGTAGGIEPKAITVFVGDTHVGKTMSMVSLAASYVRKGYDVLYVTLEMAQEKIGQLFDANYIKMEINDVPSLSFNKYKDLILRNKKNNYGRLFIREFPTTHCKSSDIRNLIYDLQIKKNFLPQIVFVDYINLMRSDRFTDNNSYFIIKSITEELRGLSGEFGNAFVSASQLNRDGAGSSNPSMRDIAESYGLPQTADCLVAMYTNDELMNKNIILWKFLKNRFGGIIDYKFALRANYEMATIGNLDDEENYGLRFIQNSPKTLKLIEKIKEKEKLHQNLKDDDNIKEDINSMFDQL